MSTVNNPRTGFLAKILEFFGINSAGKLPPADETDKKGGDALPSLIEDLDSEVLNFETFFAVKMPDVPSGTYIGKAVAEDYAVKVAQKIKEAFEAVKINREDFTLIELYTPLETDSILSTIFDTREKRDDFQRTCETQILGASIGVNKDQRVRLVDRPLTFHPAFDAILKRRLILRPLGPGRQSVPSNPAELKPGSDQLLIGTLRILKFNQEEVRKAPLLVWRPTQSQDSMRINVDFDMMTRAFDTPHMHRFPLGIDIRFNFSQRGKARPINRVFMEIQEMHKWMDYLSKVQKDKVVTYNYDRGQGFEEYPLKYHEQKSFEIIEKDTGQMFYLGTDDQGNKREVKINRLLNISVKADDFKYIYQFCFFEQVVRFDPSRNFMKVTGQLVPKNEPATILLPPSPDFHQEVLFHLETLSASPGRFKLTVPSNVTYDLNLTSTVAGNKELDPGDEVEVAIGDTIKAESFSSGGTHIFTLKDLSKVPNEVKNNLQRPYAAFVSVTSDRQFILYENENAFGRGRKFHEDAANMEAVALIFKRPYVYLTMAAGKGQEILYAKKGGQFTSLSEEGIDCDLDNIYIIYMGDFEITLNLKATPIQA